MTATTKNQFQQLLPTRKGELGEEIIYPFLKQKGWGKFVPVDDMPHPCDGFIFKMRPQFEFRAFEIKTRPKMVYYDGQGLDNHKIVTYDKLHAMGIEIIFFFIDENTRKIHASTYTKMKVETTNIENGKSITYPNTTILEKQKITLYNIRTMHDIGEISIEQANELKSLSNINEAYK